MKKFVVLLIVLAGMVSITRFFSLIVNNFSIFRLDIGTKTERETYNNVREKRIVNVGRAPFGLTAKNFKCKDFLESLDKLEFLHIAFVYNSFGNKYDCLKTLLHDPRLMSLEVHLINEPGHRNRRLEKHEFLYSISSPQKYDRLLKSKNVTLKRKFEKYVSKLQILLAEHLQPYTQLYISPGLESNVSERAGKVLVKWSREAFPNAKIVWNPLNGILDGKRVGADVIEGHGPLPSLKNHCIANLDGTDINFPERLSGAYLLSLKDENKYGKNFINSGNALRQYILTYAYKCEIVFLWVAEDNGFAYDDQLAPWVYPTKRPFRVGPVNRLLERELIWAHKQKAIPKDLSYNLEEQKSFDGCRQFRNPFDGKKRGFMMKQSEFSNRGGVILSSQYGAKKVVVLYKGKIIDVYKNSGTFPGRGPIWRSPISPIKYPFKVVVKIDDTCYKIPVPQVRID